MKRKHWVDVLKGIGIILVVIGHVCPSCNFSKWIYTFHMPLFFSLSGYLWSLSVEQTVSFKQFLKSKKNILFSFVLFRVLLVLYWLVVESHFRELDLGPIWFLIVLFVSETIAFLVLNRYREKLISNALIFTVALVLLYILKLLAVDESTGGAWIMRCVDGFMWYVAGHFMGVIIKKAHLCLKRYIKCVILGTLMITSIIVCGANDYVSIWSNAFGNYGLFIVGGIVGSLFIALFCKWIFSTSRGIEFIGQNSILILATHEPIKRVILKITEIVAEVMCVDIKAETIKNNLGLSILVVVVVFSIEIIIIYMCRFIKKKMPLVIQDNLLTFVR